MNRNPPRQRKTTLKWNSDGELSSIDKARILQKLTNRELTECELSCNLRSDNSKTNSLNFQEDYSK